MRANGTSWKTQLCGSRQYRQRESRRFRVEIAQRVTKTLNATIATGGVALG